MPNDSSSQVDPKRPWFEPVAALLMGAATLSSAWCSYQSSKWSGQSGDESAEMNRLERRATELHLEGSQYGAAQLTVFLGWLNAHLGRQEAIADFYLSRFPPPLRTAFDAWMAQKPFENQAAAPHPMMSKFYTPPFTADAKAATTEAAAFGEKADASGQNAAGYLRNTVLLAAVLFFAGTASNFDRRYVRQSTLAFGLALYVWAIVRMIIIPAI